MVTGLRRSPILQLFFSDILYCSYSESCYVSSVPNPNKKEKFKSRKVVDGSDDAVLAQWLHRFDFRSGGSGGGVTCVNLIPPF